MELKEYQTRTLDAFKRWRNALDHARNESLEDVAYYESRDRTVPEELRNYPKLAWQKLDDSGEFAPWFQGVRRTHSRRWVSHTSRLLQGSHGRRQDFAGGGCA